jgi:hypothetical protein
MLAVPSGSLLASVRRPAKGGRGKRNKGAVVARAYNELAGRPYPSNGITLEQTIRVELLTSVGIFFTASATVPVFAAASFALSSFPNAGAYTGLFDQYKFETVECWVDNNVPQGTSSFSSQFVTAIDLDDANVPSAISTVEGKQGALMTSGGCGHYHKFRPHMAVAVYSGTFTSFANAEAGWIDAGSPSVQHYGLKAGISPGPSTPSYTLTIRAVMLFRSPTVA